MVDQTGIVGTVDFTLEWTPESKGAQPPGQDVQPDQTELSFEAALHEQLGIKLESRKALLEAPVLDHVEHPSEN